MTSWSLYHCGICLHRFNERSSVVAHGSKLSPHHFHRHCAIGLALQNEVIGKIAQCPACHHPLRCDSIYSLKDRAVKCLKIGRNTVLDSMSSVKKAIVYGTFSAAVTTAVQRAMIHPRVPPGFYYRAHPLAAPALLVANSLLGAILNSYGILSLPLEHDGATPKVIAAAGFAIGSLIYLYGNTAL